MRLDFQHDASSKLLTNFTSILKTQLCKYAAQLNKFTCEFRDYKL